MKKNRVALADPFDANDESETKTRIPVWLYPSTLEAMDRVAESINCKSRSDFLERAAQFYVGYITELDACAYLPPALATAIRGTVLAAGMEISDDTLKSLRARCIQNVKKTGGTVKFDDAVKYQRGD